jgi:AraC-like DNA-binding protein
MSKAIYLLDGVLLSYYAIVIHFNSNLVLVGSSFQWLVGPTLFYTIVITTNKDFEFKYNHLLNFIPFLVHLGFMISQYHVLDYETKYRLLQHWFPYSTPWFRTVALLNYIQFATYGIFALWVLARVRMEVLRTSSQSLERNIFYFKFLIYDFIIVWGINIVSMYLPLGGSFNNILGILTVLNIFFIANTMVFQGLKFPNLFHQEPSAKLKYEKHPLTDEEKSEYVEKLIAYMKNEKPYLNPTFSLSDLADNIALPSYTLSQVLNLVMNQNFYDFVNKYRIEESKKLLMIEPGNGTTILELLYRCGFNSKSVFNAAFKKYTHMTPREFQKNMHSNKEKEALSVSLS